MKLIKSIVRPNKVDEVKDALAKLNIAGMTVTEVRGHGKQKGHTAIYRGKEYNVSLLPKMEIEVVVADAVADDVVKAIVTAARTGEIGDGRDVLVRVHSECLTGDVFGSRRCDCGPQLDAALERIAAAGRGVVLYMRGHEGRGIGLLHKLQAYQLQDLGFDTVDANLELGLPADARDYGTGAQILYDLGVRSMRLLTNNPAKRAGLEGYGLRVTGREALPVRLHPENVRYLRTKRDRMGHLFEALG
jgi:GTP cyclohydrolase II